jgi:hypothetical protein
MSKKRKLRWLSRAISFFRNVTPSLGDVKSFTDPKRAYTESR